MGLGTNAPFKSSKVTSEHKILVETWAGEARLINLCTELGFDQHWVSPQANRLGCLALFWKNIVKIDVVSSSSIHIDVVVGESTDGKWCLTGMYGFANPAKKSETWALLCQLCSRLSLLWLVAEDFNEILWSHEKCGLGPRSELQMKAFRDVLDELSLKDLGFVGKKFTWKGR